MKRFDIGSVITCMLLVFKCSFLFSQDILWERSYGGIHADYLMDVKPTADYGFILAGSSLSKKSGNKTQSSIGELDYWIWKMDESGELDWQKNLGGEGTDFLRSIALTKDGGFIIAGSSSSGVSGDKKEPCRGKDDFWIVKLDAGGGEQWQRTIGGSGQDKLQCIEQTRDGGYILGGSSSSGISGDKTDANYGNADYWLIKLSSEGALEWQRTFGGVYADELRTVQQTAEGGFIVGGFTNSPSSDNKFSNGYGLGDYWILKLTEKGVVEWQQTIGGEGDDQLYVVRQTFDKGYILGGHSNSQSTGLKSKGNQSGTDFWILKLDESGAIVWQETYNFGKTDILTSLVENDDHTFLIGGYAQSEKNRNIEGINDYIVIKIDENGEEKWQKTVGSAGEDLLKQAIVTRDGGYLLAGTSNSAISGDKNSQQGSNDFWVVKLKDNNKPKVKKAAIEAIPNPAVEYTNVIVGYDFKNGLATVVDLAGHVLQQFDITDRTVPINLSNYPEGIYIINITTEVQSDGVKVIKTSKN